MSKKIKILKHNFFFSTCVNSYARNRENKRSSTDLAQRTFQFDTAFAKDGPLKYKVSRHCFAPQILSARKYFNFYPEPS